MWLKSTLVEAAQGASRKKGSYLKDKYHRIASRRGKKRAVVAIARKILIAAYFILKDKQEYREKGAEYLDQRQRKTLQRYWVKRLEGLGFKVNLETAPEQKAA